MTLKVIALLFGILTCIFAIAYMFHAIELVYKAILKPKDLTIDYLINLLVFGCLSAIFFCIFRFLLLLI